VVHVGAAFVADDQALEVVQPGEGALDDPAVAAEAGAIELAALERAHAAPDCAGPRPLADDAAYSRRRGSTPDAADRAAPGPDSRAGRAEPEADYPRHPAAHRSRR
jgi:hypothetical protein